MSKVLQRGNQITDYSQHINSRLLSPSGTLTSTDSLSERDVKRLTKVWNEFFHHAKFYLNKVSIVNSYETKEIRSEIVKENPRDLGYNFSWRIAIEPSLMEMYSWFHLQPHAGRMYEIYVRHYQDYPGKLKEDVLEIIENQMRVNEMLTSSTAILASLDFTSDPLDIININYRYQFKFYFKEIDHVTKLPN